MNLYSGACDTTNCALVKRTTRRPIQDPTVAYSILAQHFPHSSGFRCVQFSEMRYTDSGSPTADYKCLEGVERASATFRSHSSDMVSYADLESHFGGLFPTPICSWQGAGSTTASDSSYYFADYTSFGSSQRGGARMERPAGTATLFEIPSESLTVLE